MGAKGQVQPPTLKPPLANLAIIAIKLDEYDDDFFAVMPMLFPYSKFTMTMRFKLYVGFGYRLKTNIQKLIKRTIFSDHLALLIERQEDLLAQLTQIANEGFSKAKEE